MDDYLIKGVPVGEHNSVNWADGQANPNAMYPEVYKILLNALSGVTDHVMKAVWWAFYWAVNAFMGTLAGAMALTRNNAGWINWSENKEWAMGETLGRNPSPLPNVKGVATGGNYVRGTGETKNGAIEIETFSYRALPPDVNKTNPATHPWLFDEFHGRNEKTGERGHVNGLRVFIPRLTPEGRGWLRAELLEKVDAIPSWKREGESIVMVDPVANEEEGEDVMTIRRAVGIDLAVRNQVFYKPEESEVQHDFVAIRSSYGTLLDQTRTGFTPARTFRELAEDIESVPVRLAYHWLHPDVSWQAQADLYVSLMKEFAGYFHKLVLDIEGYGGYQMRPGYGDAAQKFKLDVEGRMGMEVVPYTNPRTINELWQMGNRWLTQEKLWVAQYVYSRLSANPRVVEEAHVGEVWMPSMSPYSEGGWVMWQCSADENGAYTWGLRNGVYSNAVDWNVFNGTVVDLHVWAGIAEAVDDVPEPGSETPIPEGPDVDALIAEAVAQERGEIVEMIQGRG